MNASNAKENPRHQFFERARTFLGRFTNARPVSKEQRAFEQSLLPPRSVTKQEDEVIRAAFEVMLDTLEDQYNKYMGYEGELASSIRDQGHPLVKQHDLDAILLYTKFPKLLSYDTNDDFVPSLRSIYGTYELLPIVSDQHIDAYIQTSILFKKTKQLRKSQANGLLISDSHDDDRALLMLKEFVLARLHQSATIFQIIEQHQTTSVDDIRALLAVRDGLSNALSQGAL